VGQESSDELAPWRCSRDFGEASRARERGTQLVVALTAGMMIVELAVGYWTRSLALLADGWHMGTHAGALGLTAFAYWYARTRAHHRDFSFGTGKVHALAGYTSAITLTLVAFSMLLQSIDRLLHPATVRYREALGVAVLGLIVNLVSIKLLGHGHGEDNHSHGDGHDHDHDHGQDDGEHLLRPPGPSAHAHLHPTAHADHNHRAAVLHVAADALTSVLAIVALALGAWRGWVALDPIMGIVGGVIVFRWGVGLMRSAGRHLLDATSSESLEGGIKALLETLDDVRVADIHTWLIAPGRLACIVSLVTGDPREAAYYRERVLARFPLAHLSVEVHRAP
jgi:cation diffusion facilitator family transporter